MAAVIGAVVLGGADIGRGEAVDIDARAKEVAKSLVLVEFTLANENFSREETGQGIVISKEGVILVSGGFLPENIPHEWVQDIKVRLPGKGFTTVPAKLLGRTRDRLWAFMKTEKPIESAEVFDASKDGPTKLGQEVFSVAIFGKQGGYVTYTGGSRVKAMIEARSTIANTGSFGLTRGTSPVFDAGTGAFVGITLPAQGDRMVMSDGSNQRWIELTDEEQSSAFLPATEVAKLFKDVPTEVFESPRPWLGVDELTGIEEDFKTLKKIEQPAGVMVGSVIPGEAADKAGLKSQDVILTVNGKEFSKTVVPELMVMHLQREFDKSKPGDEVALGVLREGKKEEVKVKMAEMPKVGAQMAHVYSPKVGVTTRDLVWADLYARRIPQETKGVMVAMVKSGAPAALGTTPLKSGYLITKVGETAVENQKEFLAAVKKIEESPEQKEAVFVVILPRGETQVCRIDLTK